MRRVASVVLVALMVAAVPAARAGEHDHDHDPAPSGVVYVPVVDTPWPGKIFVAHDEWAISDYGYQLTRPSATNLTLNIARFFAGGRPGRFLSYSDFYGLIGHEIATTMALAGHSWTVDTSVPFTLETLRQYDAVFVGGVPLLDNQVLIDYVRGGGGVFVEGGTGLGGNFWEAQHWAEFLNAFGLAFGSNYDLARVPGIYAYASTSPLFTGVTQLYEQTGNPVLVDPTNPRTQNLVPYDGHALYATYSAAVIPVETEICQRLSADGDARLWLSIAGDPTFDVRSIDPASVRMLAVASDTKPVLTGGAHTRRHSPRHHFGHGHADTCLVGPDHSIDLVLGFHNRDVLLAAERLLGHPLYDGDLVAITITGRLRPERGGTPIVGESVVVVKGPRRPAPPRSK